MEGFKGKGHAFCKICRVDLSVDLSVWVALTSRTIMGLANIWQWHAQTLHRVGANMNERMNENLGILVSARDAKVKVLFIL